jgi:hypothetical protein
MDRPGVVVCQRRSVPAAWARRGSRSDSADIAAPLLASDYKLYVFSYSATDYSPCRGDTTTRRPARAAFGELSTRGSSTWGFLRLLQNYTLGATKTLSCCAAAGFSIAGNQYHLQRRVRFPSSTSTAATRLPVFLGDGGNLHTALFNQLDEQ